MPFLLRCFEFFFFSWKQQQQQQQKKPKQDNRSIRLLKGPPCLDHVPGLLWELRHVVPRQQHLAGPARLLHKRQQHDRKSDLYLKLPGITDQAHASPTDPAMCSSLEASFALNEYYCLVRFNSGIRRVAWGKKPADTNSICFSLIN